MVYENHYLVKLIFIFFKGTPENEYILFILLHCFILSTGFWKRLFRFDQNIVMDIYRIYQQFKKKVAVVCNIYVTLISTVIIYIYIFIHVKYKQKKFFWTPPPISLTEHLHEYLSEKLDSFNKFQDNLSKSYLRYPFYIYVHAKIYLYT